MDYCSQRGKFGGTLEPTSERTSCWNRWCCQGSAAGAGIPAFFTPTGVGTIVAEGKETREFEGRPYVMERWLKADFAFVRAWKGDRMGNLVYRKTARNFNPIMATAAKITIAEVEHLVEPGELDGDLVHTPSVYVKRIFRGELFERRIEKRTVRKAVIG